MVGVIGYGTYIPRYRIKLEEIAKVWGTDAESYRKGLYLFEKSVPAPDQDTITMSVEAARRAIKRAGINPKDIGSVYIGSESHPYAVKPSGTVLAEAIGATPECHSADLEFACKAGAEGMFITYSEVKAETVKYGLAVGGDTSQGAPGDALEYSASAGAACFIMGSEPDKIIAEITHTYSYMTDTPDFWRREHQFYPSHGGRFTGEPAYFKHVLGCAKGIMEQAKMKPEDFSFVVFHQPNGKFPQRAYKMLGFKEEQYNEGLVTPYLGNTYSGSSPIGTAASLDASKPGDKILMISYGSGAGSDGFIFKVTDRINQVRDMVDKCRYQLENNKTYLDYGTYVKFRRKIRKAE
jgi:hydroxymethylglutaryl-CoA synthase